MQKPDDCVRRSRLYIYAVWMNDGRKPFALRDERGQGEGKKGLPSTHKAVDKEEGYVS